MKPTLVTKLAASSEDMSNDDYLALYANLRGDLHLREFVAKINSSMSIAWWSKLDRGLTLVTRRARNELRIAAGLTPLPPTIKDVAKTIHPDAEVYRIGNGTISHAFLFTESDNLADITNIVAKKSVTRVTTRRDRHNVSIHSSIWKRLNDVRKRKNMTWDEFMVFVVESENG